MSTNLAACPDEFAGGGAARCANTGVSSSSRLATAVRAKKLKKNLNMEADLSLPIHAPFAKRLTQGQSLLRLSLLRMLRKGLGPDGSNQHQNIRKQDQCKGQRG